MRYLIHTAITAVSQVAVGLLTDNWYAGGLVLAGQYLGREIAQAEYRWIETFGLHLRSNLPWWGFMDSRIWKKTDLLDTFLPSISVPLLYFGHQLI